MREHSHLWTFGSWTHILIKSLELEGSNRVQVIHFTKGETETQRGDSISARPHGSLESDLGLYWCLFCHFMADALENSQYSWHYNMSFVNAWGILKYFLWRISQLLHMGTAERYFQKMDFPLCVFLSHSGSDKQHPWLLSLGEEHTTIFFLDPHDRLSTAIERGLVGMS